VIVGVPTELKTDEYRVALTPAGVRELVDAGHTVLVQRGAGAGSSISDEAYAAQGASIVSDLAEVYGGAELIVGVKEPQPEEVALLEPRHTLFTYLHLAADASLTRALMGTGATCIAYETVEDERGRLPLLAPMSEVAGKIATQAGAFFLGWSRRSTRRCGRSGRRKRPDHRRRRRRHERRLHSDRDGGQRICL
jgi:alanine dehydrogenase